jgi:hypothetical protein
MIVTHGGYPPDAFEEWSDDQVPLTIYLSDVGGPLRTLFGMSHGIRRPAGRSRPRV